MPAPNPLRERRYRRGLVQLWPFALLLVAQWVLFGVTLDWRYLLGTPITVTGLTLVARTWRGQPVLILLGSLIAFPGNVLPFFLTN